MCQIDCTDSGEWQGKCVKLNIWNHVWHLDETDKGQTNASDETDNSRQSEEQEKQRHGETIKVVESSIFGSDKSQMNSKIISK